MIRRATIAALAVALLAAGCLNDRRDTAPHDPAEHATWLAAEVQSFADELGSDEVVSVKSDGARATVVLAKGRFVYEFRTGDDTVRQGARDATHTPRSVADLDLEATLTRLADQRLLGREAVTELNTSGDVVTVATGMGSARDSYFADLTPLTGEIGNRAVLLEELERLRAGAPATLSRVSIDTRPEGYVALTYPTDDGLAVTTRLSPEGFTVTEEASTAIPFAAADFDLASFFDCADARGATTGFVVADAVGGPGLIRWAKPDSWEDAGGPGQVTTMGCEEVR